MQQRKKDTHYANEQSIRFVEAAKKTGANESGKTFEKAFKKIVKADKPKKTGWIFFVCIELWEYART